MQSITPIAPDDPTAPREILMVEDSPTDAQLALRAFKIAEFANPITVVGSGEEGLEHLFGTGRYAGRAPAQPHLILLDLNLPGMSGVEFLRRIRGERRTRDVPVIVLSMSARDRDVTACVQLGAEAYIVKPVNFENFTKIVAGLKSRLTLIARPRDGNPGGWVLSGPCVVSGTPGEA